MLGRVALDPSDSTLTAGMSGAIVHLFLATLFGSIFGAILLVAVQLDVVMRGRTIVLAASVYGLMLWLINFYGLAPLAGLSWFPSTTSPSVPFVAHTFCYGTVLGLYIKRTITTRRAPWPIARPMSRRRAGQRHRVGVARSTSLSGAVGAALFSPGSHLALILIWY